MYGFVDVLVSMMCSNVKQYIHVYGKVSVISNSALPCTTPTFSLTNYKHICMVVF